MAGKHPGRVLGWSSEISTHHVMCIPCIASRRFADNHRHHKRFEQSYLKDGGGIHTITQYVDVDMGKQLRSRTADKIKKRTKR